jgi:glyoxylase-like metal-dependent hydrolase (beta-lactamase superfamily II)
MQIAPRVHAVPTLGAVSFLICEERLTLIDAGLRGSRRRLERYLVPLGRSLEELDRIVCTHAHPDHIGGVREIVRGSGARVLMHPADIAMLGLRLPDAVRSRSRADLIAALTRGPEEAVPVEDGDVLPVLGGLQVVHTPGHTPGSICLYAASLRMLFVGDVLQIVRGRVAHASTFFSRDMPMARASLARLAELDVETIAFSHYPPWQGDVPATLRRLAGDALPPPGGTP